MRRLWWALGLLLLSAPASAQNNCITVNGATQCAAPWRIYDQTQRVQSLPVIDLSQGWNNGSITFTGIKLNVTNTNSATASKLMDLQVGAVSKFSVDLSGNITGGTLTGGTYLALGAAPAQAGALRLSNNTTINWRNVSGSGDIQAFVIFTDNQMYFGQSGVHFQPNTNNLQDLGATAETWRTGYFGTSVAVGSATLNATSLVTAPTDSTAVDAGTLTRFRASSTITPATAGVGNCGAAFLAAALTADCTIATLPAGMKLVGIYADVTVGFACSGTCSGTKVVQCGTAAGGAQILAAGLNVAVTGTFGLADADLGSGMTRAAAIQGGLIGSWSTTTPVSCRFTSGTGNWGNAATTFVNAGSIKFTLITEQVK